MEKVESRTNKLLYLKLYYQKNKVKIAKKNKKHYFENREIMLQRSKKSQYRNSYDKCFCGNRKTKEAKNCVKCYSNKHNPMWKGDKAGLGALHAWVRRHKQKSKLCECCQEKPPFDLANISQEYKRDITDYEWLCRKCHMTKDGRLKTLLKLRGEINGKGRAACV